MRREGDQVRLPERRGSGSVPRPATGCRSPRSDSRRRPPSAGRRPCSTRWIRAACTSSRVRTRVRRHDLDPRRRDGSRPSRSPRCARPSGRRRSSSSSSPLGMTMLVRGTLVSHRGGGARRGGRREAEPRGLAPAIRVPQPIRPGCDPRARRERRIMDVNDRCCPPYGIPRRDADRPLGGRPALRRVAPSVRRAVRRVAASDGITFEIRTPPRRWHRLPGRGQRARDRRRAAIASSTRSCATSATAARRSGGRSSPRRSSARAPRR